MLDYYYCNSALIIYCFTIYLFYVKKHIKDNQSRIFESMLWVSAASCLFDVISEEAIGKIGSWPTGYVYVAILLFYILQSSIPFLSSLYVFTLVDRLRRLNLMEKIILYMPILVTDILLLLNYHTKVFFYFDSNLKYHHGVGYSYLFVHTIYYLVLNMIYIIYYRQYIPRKIRYLLLPFALAVVFFIRIEFRLNLMIHNLGIAFCELLLFIAVQNTEESLVDASGLFTQAALIKRSQLDLKNKSPFTIILIKLEDKAIINYTFGLNYWFAILSEVSAYLTSVCKSDAVYTLQDGLFAIMQRNDLPTEEKNRILNNITYTFKNNKWKVLNTELSLSVQMLEFSYPKDIDEINDVLYYIEYYSKNMITSKNVLLNVTNLNDTIKKYHKELRKALWDIVNSCQYELFFMPIYSAVERRVISREPLLKLPTDPPVYISPAELDNITEDYLRLKHIHESIFEDICKYLNGHPCSTDRIEYMNYKMTAAQLMQEDMIENYSFLIKKYQIDYHRLGIEMSEATVSYVQPTILQNIMSMKSLGVTFILDQFGKGYNSLDYFKYLSFEFVKLDKSIVKACLDNDKGLTVIKSMIAMMKQLKVMIIADGVDTKELADLLISLDVDSLEGSYYL